MKSAIKAKTSAIVVLLVLIPNGINSSQEHIDDHHQSIGPRLSLQIMIHGFLLWASMGFLIPIGILIIRFSNREESGRRLRVLFFVHAASQMASVGLVLAGAVMSIQNFENAFDNMHQRLGVTLYGLVFLQAFCGLLRPVRGSKKRSVWFFVHWVLGTAVSLLGVVNVYTGLHAYQKKTSRNVGIWVVFYTVEVVCIGFFYVFQDKCDYIQKQGVALGNEPSTTVRPADDREILARDKDEC